jgi:dihydrofolate synthase / folylpolyglutamate synthase
MDYQTLIARLTQRGQFRIKPGLERIQAVLNVLGHPQDSIKSVHIAGTNGKGSTAAYLESVLRQAGYKTGFYTSPHLWDVRERIQINRHPIGVSQFWTLAQDVLNAEQQAKVSLTYFEFLTVMAFLAFSRETVDIAIIETGMGGRWDATNVLVKPEVSIITSIGLDHLQWLGKTESAIAKEKAGIAKAAVPLISGARGKAATVIAKVAQSKKAILREIDKDFRSVSDSTDWHKGWQTVRFTAISSTDLYTIGLLGPHQVHNATLALAAIDELAQKGWRIGKAAIREGMAKAEWAGRFQWQLVDRIRVLFDGAHNPDAMRKLLETLKASPWSEAPKTFIFGAYKDKDYRGMIKLIRPEAERIIVCTLPGERSLLAREISKAFPRDVKIVEEPREALQAARSWVEPEGLIVVTGSLSLVGLLLEDTKKRSHLHSDEAERIL